MTKHSFLRPLSFVGLLLYTALLAKLILFKGRLFFSVVPSTAYYKNNISNGTYTDNNLVPFRVIRMFVAYDVFSAATFFNLAGNVLLFVPFGLLFSLVSPRPRLSILASFALSTLFEAYQAITRTGNGDIDDVMLNTLGGVIGYGLFCLGRNYIIRRHRVAPTKQLSRHAS